jgi:hypothetical protein
VLPYEGVRLLLPPIHLPVQHPAQRMALVGVQHQQQAWDSLPGRRSQAATGQRKRSQVPGCQQRQQLAHDLLGYVCQAGGGTAALAGGGGSNACCLVLVLGLGLLLGLL